MEEMITTITAKGQVTIPISLRKKLGLEPSDKVAFVLDGDTIRMSAVNRNLLAGYRAVKPRQQPEDFEAIHTETTEWVAKQVIDELHDSRER
jgi:antitoxin PrlF